MQYILHSTNPWDMTLRPSNYEEALPGCSYPCMEQNCKIWNSRLCSSPLGHKIGIHLQIQCGSSLARHRASDMERAPSGLALPCHRSFCLAWQFPLHDLSGLTKIFQAGTGHLRSGRASHVWREPSGHGMGYFRLVMGPTKALLGLEMLQYLVITQIQRGEFFLVQMSAIPK